MPKRRLIKLYIATLRSIAFINAIKKICRLKAPNVLEQLRLI